MSLEWLPQPPPPPSYAEMASAILDFHAEFYDMHWSDYSGTPADLTLLSLAERLAASRGMPSECPVADPQRDLEA